MLRGLCNGCPIRTTETHRPEVEVKSLRAYIKKNDGIYVLPRSGHSHHPIVFTSRTSGVLLDRLCLSSGGHGFREGQKRGLKL